jgi:alpha-ribazole phosphatase
MRLLLARHGRTTWNAERRYQGQRDVPLDQEGRLQADALAHRLSDEPIDAIYASDLRRAWETAEAIAALQGLRVQLEPRLREIAFGDWEGLTTDEIEQASPGAIMAWRDDPRQAPPPGGENLDQVTGRVRAAVTDIAASHQDETVLVVAHGGVLRVLVCMALDLPADAFWRFRFDQASLSQVDFYESGSTLSILNDTAHLRPKPRTD